MGDKLRYKIYKHANFHASNFKIKCKNYLILMKNFTSPEKSIINQDLVKEW